MALLGLLDRESSHGYDLKRDYDTYFGRGRPLLSEPIPAEPHLQTESTTGEGATSAVTNGDTPRSHSGHHQPLG